MTYQLVMQQSGDGTLTRRMVGAPMDLSTIMAHFDMHCTMMVRRGWSAVIADDDHSRHIGTNQSGQRVVVDCRVVATQ